MRERLTREERSRRALHVGQLRAAVEGHVTNYGDKPMSVSAMQFGAWLGTFRIPVPPELTNFYGDIQIQAKRLVDARGNRVLQRRIAQIAEDLAKSQSRTRIYG